MELEYCDKCGQPLDFGKHGPNETHFKENCRFGKFKKDLDRFRAICNNLMYHYDHFADYVEGPEGKAKTLENIKHTQAQFWELLPKIISEFHNPEEFANLREMIDSKRS
jgi:hypothetical protein